jgi:hypothetical protein
MAASNIYDEVAVDTKGSRCENRKKVKRKLGRLQPQETLSGGGNLGSLAMLSFSVLI